MRRMPQTETLSPEAAHDLEHPFPEGGARELMATLPSAAVRSLLHVLECPSCQDAALGDLADVLEARPDDPPADPVLRREIETLLAELLAVPAKEREEAILQDRRFHRLDLLDLVLEEGEAKQGRGPGRTTNLAPLAVWLGSVVRPDARGLGPRLMRGFCLDATARRLAGKLGAADDALDSASYFLSGEPEDLGLYCRTLGLLRWEQGRLYDAAALLRQGAQAWGEARRRREQGACLILLGLVHLEAEQIAKAPGPLFRGLVSRKGQPPSRLSAQGSLSLALCLAMGGREEEARQVRELAWQLHVMPEPCEQAEVTWLEGRIAAHLGEAGEAERLLDTARAQLLAARRVIDAGLASLDLAAVYAQAGRGARIGSLVQDLEISGAGLPETKEVVHTLRDLTKAKPGRDIAKAAALAAYLRRTCRVRFPGRQTLPWV
jgi:tetratricopeptide (TPR) repeat protein